MNKPEGSWATEMEEEFHGLPPPQPPTRLLAPNPRINQLLPHYSYGGDLKREQMNSLHFQANGNHHNRHEQNFQGPNVNRHHPVNLRYASQHRNNGRTYPAVQPPNESKKDKFPNYLHHVAPEDDPLATRTLFAGNLEMNISEEDLRAIFGKFGKVDDVDIKRPPPGTGNAYAFVRFSNLDMAAKAKSELSGQYIGKFQVKIGYGKANPSTKVWVGGLGHWTTIEALKSEFSRFGMIRGIEWTPGETEAFISYEMVESAQIAVKELRGFYLGGQDHRIRTDFADTNEGELLGHNHAVISSMHHVANPLNKYGGEETIYYEMPPPLFMKPPTFRPNVDLFVEKSQVVWNEPRELQNSAQNSAQNAAQGQGDVQLVQPRLVSRPTTPQTAILDRNTTTTMSNYVGSFTLKNMSFSAEFWLMDGSFPKVEHLLIDESRTIGLRITQRLRVDAMNVEEVNNRLRQCSSFAVMMAYPPSPSSSTQETPNGFHRKHLAELVSYLNGKEAAGVISASNEGSDVVYAFPPSPFAEDFLNRFSSFPREGRTFILVIAITGIPSNPNSSNQTQTRPSTH